MNRIEFEFKPIIPNSLAAPVILTIPHYKEKRGRNLLCIVDSGADITTIPMYIGIEMGINFSNTSIEMYEPWLEILEKINGGIDYDYSSFLKTLYDKNLCIPVTFNCACGKTTSSLLFPIEIEMGNQKFFTMVNWAKNDGPALLGRFGIFDKFKEVVFNKRERKGHFVLD